MNRRILLSTALAVLLLAPPARAETIRIAVAHALTGPVAFVGIPVMNAIKLAADEINASGRLGADKIVLETADTGSDKTQALTLARRYGEDAGILVFLGPTSSIEGLAVAPLINDLKLPTVMTALSGEVLKAGPYAFKGTTAPQDFITVVAKYAFEKLKLRRCALIFDRQNEATVAQKNLFRDLQKQMGGTILSDDGILGSDTDFAALSTKVIDLQPDCVFLSAQGPVDGNLAIQLRQNGLPDSTKIIGTPSMATDQYLSVAGAAAEGTFMTADFVPGGRDDAGRNFVANYQKRFGAVADNYAAIGYTMMHLVGDAILRAGTHTDRAKFRDAFATMPPTPTILGDGTFTIDKDRLVHYGAALLTVKGGKFVAPPQ